MGKIIKLTEDQLAKIIKSVIKESNQFDTPGIKQDNLTKFLRKLNNRPEPRSYNSYSGDDDWMADLAFRGEHPEGELDGRMRKRNTDLSYIKPISDLNKKYKSTKPITPDYAEDAEDVFDGVGVNAKHDDPQDDMQTDKGVPLTPTDKYKESINKHVRFKKGRRR